jgi:transcription initiation factor TFIIE subunit alpha
MSTEKLDQLAVQVGGEAAVNIVRFLLANGENISEFLMAEKLGIEINTIRKTLYLLQENNLVFSMRKKDKRKGWYIYYWTFDEIEAGVLITKLKSERIKNLKKRLEKETETTYYKCEKSCIRMNYENAMNSNFTCPECSRILNEADNTKQVKIIKEEIESLEETKEKVEV